MYLVLLLIRKLGWKNGGLFFGRGCVIHEGKKGRNGNGNRSSYISLCVKSLYMLLSDTFEVITAANEACFKSTFPE